MTFEQTTEKNLDELFNVMESIGRAMINKAQIVRREIRSNGLRNDTFILGAPGFYIRKTQEIERAIKSAFKNFWDYCQLKREMKEIKGGVE